MGDLYRDFIERDDLAIHKWHHYFPIYERHFARYRGRPVRMLEIGVQNGGSAKLFLDWLGPDARLVGVDIDPACRNHTIPGRLDIEIGDQADRAFLERLSAQHGPWDIILDDGGHTANQIIVSFEELFPSLQNGGCYLIEDTHAPLWGDEFQDHPAGKTIAEFLVERFQGLHHWTGQRDLFGRWHQPPDARPSPIAAPELARTASALHLYELGDRHR